MSAPDLLHRFGYTAVLGVPNAGKSSLVNAWVGQKVSIVSPKPQTTRRPIAAVGLHREAQIVFFDAPGIFESGRTTDRLLLKSAWQTLDRAHVVCLVIDPARRGSLQKRMAEQVMAWARRPVVVVINKIDRVSKETLLACAATYGQNPGVRKIFMVSAVTGDGVSDVLDALVEELPVQPWMYPEDQISTLSERFLAEEMTREQVFVHTHQEIPYDVRITTEQWSVAPSGETTVHQVIHVSKASWKAILLGRKGEKIKAMGTAARRHTSDLLQRKVHLFLHVKVMKKSGSQPEPGDPGPL